MLRVTWRNLFARKIRLILSAFAIVLGVAFVTGSLIYTDTLGESFDGIIEGSTADVTVRQEGAGASDDGGLTPDSRSIPAATVAELGAAPGAARVDGTVEGQGLFIIDKDGKLVGGQGAPTLAFNYNDAPSITGDPSVTIAKGEEPRGMDEVAIDETTAKNAGYKIGDTVQMVTAGADPQLSAKLVGLAQFAGGGLAGASLVFFDTTTAQAIFLDGKDEYDSVAVTAKDGVSQQELAGQLQELLPAGLEAATGEKIAKETKDVVSQAISFISTFLLIFAAIALVVGTFLIINTFSILVAQRSRELALLRAMGASRRQVTRSVLLESLVVGLVGSTLGLALGFGLAAGLKVLFAQFGLDLAGTALVFAPRTAIAAYAVGVIVTMIAAYLPARRASRISPVAAMRDDIAMPESSLRIRMAVGGILGVIGAVGLTLGLAGSGKTGAGIVGLGVFAILVAVALMSPVIGRPVLHGLGALYRRAFGTVGILATQNSLRNPRRTAATASALMIGLTLVTTMSILGGSANASIDAGVRKEFTSDYLISSPAFASFSTAIGEQIRQLPETGEVAQTQFVQARIKDDNAFLTAGSATDLKKIYELAMESGSLGVGDKQIALSKSAAADRSVTVGDTVPLDFPAGEQRARVVGIYEDSNVVGDAVVPFSTLAAAKIPRQDSVVSVNAAEGSSAAALGKRLDTITKDLPMVTVQNQADFIEAQRGSVNQLLALIYALLGLAIVIAVLGIINTLALSVIERTREVGLLRAVGLSRRQLRRMVRLEAVAIAVLGAVLGVVMGLVFGIVLQRALVGEGITDLSIPAVNLVVFVVIAAVVGVLAAVLPARRAAKLNVLRAISTE